MFTPYSVQCFTPRTGLPTGSSPLGNALHYVVKVLVACSAYYRWARSLYSAHLLILPTILGYLLRIKADCCRFVTHPTPCLSGSQSWSGVGFLTDLLSPSPPTAKSGLVGVPRRLDGELSVTDLPAPAVMSQRFVETAVAMGYDDNPDFNGSQQEGAGFYQFTIKDGKRHSTAAAFLLPIFNRPNLTTTTGALVTRLLFEGTRAVGVEYLHNDMLHQVKINQEVILSAGAFDSPKLLMLSGIGDAAHLQALGIPVVADLPGVGQNLQDHVLVPITYQSTAAVHPASSSSGIGEAGLFLHSEHNLDVTPDLQCFAGPILWAPPGSNRSGPGFFGVASLTHPHNIGSVSLRPAKGNASAQADATRTRVSALQDPPLIRLNYLESETDVQTLVVGIKRLRQIFETPAFDEFQGDELAPGIDMQSDEAIATYIRGACETMYHPVGTCKMGSDPMAVVDPELRVHGIEGLRVVDASIMPTIVTGNTNAPTIAIAEKAADLIKAAHYLQQRRLALA